MIHKQKSSSLHIPSEFGEKNHYIVFILNFSDIRGTKLFYENEFDTALAIDSSSIKHKSLEP